jgi:hypothetical protein
MTGKLPLLALVVPLPLAGTLARPAHQGATSLRPLVCIFQLDSPTIPVCPAKFHRSGRRRRRDIVITRATDYR